MKPKEKPIVHLLKPSEYRVWCQTGVPGGLTVTIHPFKATCANCLSKFVNRNGGHKTFRVAHIPARMDEEVMSRDNSWKDMP